MRGLERRLLRLELAREAWKPVEPWRVMHPHHLSGSPEAEAEEKAFRAEHGSRVVIVRLVDGRRGVAQ